MNLSDCDIHFTKQELILYEDLYDRLLEHSNGGYRTGHLSADVIKQLFNHLRRGLSPDTQYWLVNYMKHMGSCERKDFYLFMRRAAILHSGQSLTKELVYKFETPPAFIELISTTVHKICSNGSTDRDNSSASNSIVLPPPLPPPKLPTTADAAGKTKLKRVHTISGPEANATNNTNVISASINPSSFSANALFTSPVAPCFNSISGYLELDNTISAMNSQSPLFSDNISHEDIYDFWRITPEQKEYYLRQFASLQSDTQGTVGGNVAKIFFEKSGLPVAELSRIWKLSDCDRDGALSLPEFCIAMHLVVLRRNNVDIPADIPHSLLEIYSNLAAVEGYRYSPPFGSTGAFSKYSIYGKDDGELLEKVIKSNSTNPGTASSSSACSTKNWTQFDDLMPAPPSGSESHSRSSPDQQPAPVNFDYNQESISTNPMIKHPVPLRFSPAAAVAVANLSPLSSMTNVSTNPFPNSDSTSEWPLSPNVAGDTASDLLSPTSISFWSNGGGASDQQQSYRILSDETALDPTTLNELEECIITRYKAPPEVIIPKAFNSPEDLQKSLLTLKTYANTVTRQNQLLLEETLSLVKVVRRLYESSRTPATNSNHNNNNAASFPK